MALGDADASTPAFVKANAGTKDATTASFTPPNGALLVACCWHDTAGGNVTNTSAVTDSLGLTWTRRLTVSKQDDGTGFANGHLAVSTATATGAAMTVTTTGTNTNNPAAIYVRVVTGADTTTPMDATPVEGTSTNAVISQAITTATDGARAFLIATDWNLAANMTAGASQTAIVADGIGAPDMRVYLGVQNAVTSPAGSVTMSTASPSTGNTNNFAVFALRPAAGGATSLNVGNAALTVAANSAGLSASLAATHGAAAIAANGAGLQASPAAGNAAVSVGASSGSLIASVGATFGAVSVGAFDATVTGGATAINAGSAAVSVGAFDATLTGGTVITLPGSWYGLLDILNEVRAVVAEERARPPEACWHDGEPLRSHRGVLYCPFCGRHYAGDGSTV